MRRSSVKPAPAFMVLPPPQPLLRRKAVDDRILIHLVGLEDDRREIRVVGRIWEMLRLHAEAVPEIVDLATLTLDRAVDL